MLTEIKEADTPCAPLNTKVAPHIRIINAALDEDLTTPGLVVVTGRIDQNTLRFLKADQEYQRPLGNRADIFDALKAGVVVPNIEIGVRGEDFETDGDDVVITSPAYIIDGWQRVGTALRILEDVPSTQIRLFGTLHFGTDSLWERHRFTDLNNNIRKVSPNLHLRNMRDSNPAILTLFGLSNNTKDFPLYKRVCWAQNMRRGDLTSARNIVSITAALHQHLAGGNYNGSTLAIAEKNRIAADKIKLNVFRQNVVTFFEAVDGCWPFNQVERRQRATQLKAGFLIQLARLLSLHKEFWRKDDHELFLSSNDRKKLGKFPLNDAYVSNLAGAGGTAKQILFDLLLRHMNSGRRTNRLTLRY